MTPTPTPKTAPSPSVPSAYDRAQAAVNARDNQTSRMNGSRPPAVPAEVAALLSHGGDGQLDGSAIDIVNMTPAQIVERQRELKLEQYRLRPTEDHHDSHPANREQDEEGDDDQRPRGRRRDDRRARDDKHTSERDGSSSRRYSDREIRQARETLERTRLWDADELDNLDDAALVRKAKRVERGRSRQSADFREFQSSRTRTNAKPHQVTSTNRNGAPQSQVPAPRPNVAELVKPFAEYGEELGTAAKGAFDAFQKENDWLRTRLEQLEGQFGGAGNGRSRNGHDAAQNDDVGNGHQNGHDPHDDGELPDADIVEDTLLELSETYPDLEDDDVREEVMEIAARLSTLPAYQRRGRTRRDNRKLLIAAAIDAAGLERDGGPADPERNLRRNGRPTANRVAPRGARAPADPKDRARIKFEHLRAFPGDIAGARRAAGEL